MISGKRKRRQNEVDTSAEQFFAKYLTNQNLLQLQLSDSNFRRYLLIQFLILFQYLKSTVKFKSEANVLTDEQSKWIGTYVYFLKNIFSVKSISRIFFPRAHYDQNVSKVAKNQVYLFLNGKQSLSAFFVSILMYCNMSPRNFLIIWKFRSNCSILRNMEKVTYWKKLPI